MAGSESQAQGGRPLGEGFTPINDHDKTTKHQRQTPYDDDN
jgi:hypothetical protein